MLEIIAILLSMFAGLLALTLPLLAVCVLLYILKCLYDMILLAFGIKP